MSSTLIFAPPNSQVIICDRSGGAVPPWTSSAPILATSSCIVVHCLMFQDGPTAFVLGAVGDVDPGEAPALDRVIDTPSLSLAVFTIDWRALLEQQVGRPRTRTRIWTNRRDEPDRVIIGIG